MRRVVTLLERASQRQFGQIVRKPIKFSTVNEDVTHEIENINPTNAGIFRSVTFEGTLSGDDSCQLKCKYSPQAAVAPVMHIQVYFT